MRISKRLLYNFLILFFAVGASARALGPADCEDMEVWDYASAMCMPRTMAGMPMTMLMFHYNAFFTETAEDGPRGRNALTVPNMFMVDAGTSVGDRHYVNFEFMGTFERWTYPAGGYPLLLQIGEENQDHLKYLDAQHPHSSPIMGLTFSDTISLGEEKDYAKFWFAPRGNSTDGPIAFMHRPTGMVNPDAPLGHHIGQDVGHISSTVIGASLRKNSSTLELSTFNGTEPEPSKVDLPMATPNSYAGRWIQEFTPHHFAMVSAASVDHVWRYSGSLYADHLFESGWTMHNAFIYGLVNNYDNASALNSFAVETWLHQDTCSFWSRLEILQRTPDELQVLTTSPNDPKWVSALTLGSTHQIAKWSDEELGLGVSVTKNFLPAEFQTAYGGDPLAGKIFLQVGGMTMSH
jgi:hypothetical protein